MKLYLSVDTNSLYDRTRLEKFEKYVSYHVANSGHEVHHKQIENFTIRRV